MRTPSLPSPGAREGRRDEETSPSEHTPTALQRANDERDAREVDGGLVVHQELGERAGRQARRSDRVRVRRRPEGERDRQLVGADGLRVVAVVAGAEVLAQAVVDDLTQFLQGMEDLPGRVPALAAQRKARAVPRPGGLRR
jgi:hypothetical protein